MLLEYAVSHEYGWVLLLFATNFVRSSKSCESSDFSMKTYAWSSLSKNYHEELTKFWSEKLTFEMKKCLPAWMHKYIHRILSKCWNHAHGSDQFSFYYWWLNVSICVLFLFISISSTNMEKQSSNAAES